MAFAFAFFFLFSLSPLFVSNITGNATRHTFFLGTFTPPDQTRPGYPANRLRKIQKNKKFLPLILHKLNKPPFKSTICMSRLRPPPSRAGDAIAP
ncbi:hypothetical protein F5X96DRAFT_436439 [Biscogniauxia mediterranea]|nr:hypothetical protein F5X96DRAFT_436439 [Biscogniauxia mediterranea]